MLPAPSAFPLRVQPAAETVIRARACPTRHRHRHRHRHRRDVRRGPRALACIGLVLLVAGCASVPDYEYYTLDQRGLAMAGSAAGISADIRLERLQAGQALARPELMIQISPVAVDYYATAHWVSDVGELATETLRRVLESSESGEDGPTIYISGDVLEFHQLDPGAAGNTAAAVTAALRLRFEEQGTGERRARRYAIQRPIASGEPAAVARGLSGAMAALAQEISRDLATWYPARDEPVDAP